MRTSSEGIGARRKAVLVAVLTLVASIAVAATQALGHIERASYWPDPAPDTAVTPATGGKVPEVRSLYTALDESQPGTTRVVCQGSAPSSRAYDRAARRVRTARRRGASRRALHRLRRARVAAYKVYRRAIRANPSIARLRKSVGDARALGWKLRTSEAKRTLSKADGVQLLRYNERLLGACRFSSIQAAVTASGNNDRVVIMPGVYTEPESRAKPTNDPACASLRQDNDKGQGGAVSYTYQYRCPNDQNLIAVMGREPGSGTDPQPPRWERRGIPNLGACVRCNVQMEGSGQTPEDVVVEAGNVNAGNGGPSGIGSAKDVGIRADRADGFVLRNITVRHAHEHTIYILESDGYVAERFHTYYPGEYGLLTFVEDHGLIQDCEAMGSGDAGLYPGASADTGEETAESRQRYSQELRNCDMHHNAAGYSGTTGNAVHVHHNEFYDNALGLTTDVFTASGHPGFPTDSMLIENNNFHSNNFNPFARGSDVEPTIPVPVGTGMWIAGGNNHTVRNNHFWDNWRRGTMVFSVPDSFVCGPAAGGNEQAGCDASKTSTSHRNKHYGNVMGRDPSGRVDPNGVDFWWDEYPNNLNNCWYNNTGKDGTAGSVTSEPRPLPSDCATSRGTGNGAHEGELLGCFTRFEYDSPYDCPWFTTPAEPKP